MNNFDFYNPTKIIFGSNQIEQIKNEVPEGAKVLLLYGGGSIKRNGVFDQVMSALSDFEVIEFGGILANPEYDTLLKALEVIKSEKVDFILAVGGGSVIDGTKFLSSATLYDGNNPWDILTNRIRTFEGLPFGTVLTMPATGSEMNSGAVITRESTKEKLTMGGPGLFPKFSVLDPNVVKSIPKRQIANGLTDSFVHVLEQYMTYPVGAGLQDRFAESILSNILEIAPKMMGKEFNETIAGEYMWSCTMALNGLIQKGVPTDWAIHIIGHELTALYGIDHARTLAILTKSHYTKNFESKKEKLAQCAERVFGISKGTIDEKAQKCIDKIEGYFHSLDIKTKLSEYTKDFVNAPQLIASRMEERGWVELGERGEVTPKVVEEIVGMSL